MRRGTTTMVAVLVALGLVAALGYVFLRGSLGPLVAREGCTATVGDRTVRLSTEQAENAALIAAISVRRGLPARAATIALATAYQESKIANLRGGDRDSLGIFQQRPSQGWGTQEEILDPVYATNTFYDALQQVDGYRELDVTVAAQAVQRSGFPDAYADHEADARVLASALTGNSPAALTCRVRPETDDERDRLDDAGLTDRAAAVRRDVTAAFGDLALGGFQPEGVSTGHQEGSAHYEGRALDIFVRPVNAANKQRGWAIAQYLVARARLLDLDTVIFDGRIWTARRAGQGWRDYDPGSRPGDRAILEHRDHVHVDVAD